MDTSFFILSCILTALNGVFFIFMSAAFIAVSIGSGTNTTSTSPLLCFSDHAHISALTSSDNSKSSITSPSLSIISRNVTFSRLLSSAGTEGNTVPSSNMNGCGDEKFATFLPLVSVLIRIDIKKLRTFLSCPMDVRGG